jgi:hypothetical protein
MMVYKEFDEVKLKTGQTGCLVDALPHGAFWFEIDGAKSDSDDELFIVTQDDIEGLAPPLKKPFN